VAEPKPNADCETTDNKLPNNIKMTIVGVYRTKLDSLYDSSSELIYPQEAIEQLILANNTTQLMKDQIANKTKNLLTNNNFRPVVSASLTGDALIAANASADALAVIAWQNAVNELGYIDPVAQRALPNKIQIYAKGFDAKQNIKDLIDDYNAGITDSSLKISVNDLGSILTSTFSTILGAVTVVLTAFSSISLVVSSIMIGIITFISVLERTKEIGILRAIGARKKDISRVFNAETIIIGFIAGLMGVVLSSLLSFPINMIINSMDLGMRNLMAPSLLNGILMIVISCGLTLIAGLIPSTSASKKDPVTALRTE
jgi:putative ABC transport system permease protein